MLYIILGLKNKWSIKICLKRNTIVLYYWIRTSLGNWFFVKKDNQRSLLNNLLKYLVLKFQI